MLQTDHLLSLNWEILQIQQIQESAWKLKISKANHPVILWFYKKEKELFFWWNGIQYNVVIINNNVIIFLSICLGWNLRFQGYSKSCIFFPEQSSISFKAY